MPDAAAYGDAGSDTLGNIARLRGLHAAQPVPRWAWATSSRSRASPPPPSSRGRLRPLHAGLARQGHHHRPLGNGGHSSRQAVPALSRTAFRREIMDEFERRIGRRTLGNKAASGTEIIKELGAEHMRTGSPIVYTSADSVFQVAAHEEVIPLWELYKICETAREILRGPHEVGRVIARPFIGAPGAFHAHLQPPRLRRAAARAACCSTGSTSAASRSTAWARSSTSFWAAASANPSRPRTTPTAWPRRSRPCDSLDAGLIFVNLVDFDQQYGHRNDVEGYGAALEAVRRAGCRNFSAALQPGRPGDLHRRPRLRPHHALHRSHAASTCRCWSSGRSVQPRRRTSACARSLSDIGQTVAENFGATIANGASFLRANLMRKPVMAGNWKMYKTPAETTAFFEKFRPLVEKARALRDRDLSAFHEPRRGRGRRQGQRASASARRTSPGPRKAPSPARFPAP